jgi:hypothetical protein
MYSDDASSLETPNVYVISIVFGGVITPASASACDFQTFGRREVALDCHWCSLIVRQACSDKRLLLG